MRADDYDELPVELYSDDDETTDLWIHLRGKDGQEDKRSLIVLKDLSIPTRYMGWWLIGHEFVGRRATAFVRADDVLYFDIFENRPKDEH